MGSVNIVLQGKGGVGKSVVASFIAQHYIEKQQDFLAFDTDPVNATFSGYKSIGAKHIDIMDDDDIDPRKFDQLIELIAESTDKAIIIDNGAASFVALASYLKSNGVVELLNEMGHEVFIHTVVTSGQAQKDTLIGFNTIAENFGNGGAKIIVWQNEFWGKVEQDGKTFEQMKVYKENAERVHSVITIPELKKQTFAQDLADMLTAKLTFAEAIEGTDFPLMAKQRLKMVKKDLFENMEAAL